MSTTVTGSPRRGQIASHRCGSGEQAAPRARRRFRLPRASTTPGQLESDLEAAISRGDELRGLLGAYWAKAARLGSAEDPGLTERHNRARSLLWTAPCDLAAAADAVTGYQQAILALGGKPR